MGGRGGVGLKEYGWVRQPAAVLCWLAGRVANYTALLLATVLLPICPCGANHCLSARLWLQVLVVAIGLCESYRVSLGWATPTGTGFNNVSHIAMFVSECCPHGLALYRLLALVLPLLPLSVIGGKAGSSPMRRCSPRFFIHSCSTPHKRTTKLIILVACHALPAAAEGGLPARQPVLRPPGPAEGQV